MRNLLRALHQFTRTSGDATLKREAAAMNRSSTAALAALMLPQRDKIQHADPESAIHFAVLMVAAVIKSVILDDEGTHGLSAPDDLEEELTRAVFGYLGLGSSR